MLGAVLMFASGAQIKKRTCSKSQGVANKVCDLVKENPVEQWAQH